MFVVEIQIKDGEIQEEQHFRREDGHVLDDPYDGDDHKQELRVKEDAEGIGGAVVGMSHHKPDDREECRGCEDVMGGVMFGDENNTEYTDEERDDGEEGPPRVLCDASLVFVGEGEHRHQEHTCGDEVPGLEWGGAFSENVMKGSLLVMMLDMLRVAVAVAVLYL